MCLAAKAKEPTIVIQLERSSLEKVVRQAPRLYANMLAHIKSWLHASHPEQLMRHWLLCGCAGRKAFVAFGR